MHAHKGINPFSKQNDDTGFASNINQVGGRFMNKDGSYNLKKEGMSFMKRFSLFHDMLTCLYGNSSQSFLFFSLQST